MVLVLHRWKTLHFSLFNFMRYLLAHFANQRRSLSLKHCHSLCQLFSIFVSLGNLLMMLPVTIQATDRDTQQYQPQYLSLLWFTGYQQPTKHQGHWSPNCRVQWFSQFSTRVVVHLPCPCFLAFQMRMLSETSVKCLAKFKIDCIHGSPFFTCCSHSVGCSFCSRALLLNARSRFCSWRLISIFFNTFH